MAARPNIGLNPLLVPCLIACFSLQARAGKLDAVRDAVHGESGECHDSPGGDSYYDDSGDHPEEYWDSYDPSGDRLNPWWLCLFPPVGLLICLPKVIIESPEDTPKEREFYQDWIPSAYFLSHPYAQGHRGFLFTTGKICSGEPLIREDTFETFAAHDPDAERIHNLPDLNTWSLRLAAEYAYDYDSVHRPNISASFDSIYRLGLTTRWTHYIEPLGGGEVDQLTIGDVNVTYRFAHSDIAEVRIGLGWRMIFDGEYASGINAVYLINIFPTKPLVISTSGDVGNLGKALYLHARSTIGAQLGPAEPYLGYDLVQISGASAEVLFHGPVAGIRIWL